MYSPPCNPRAPSSRLPSSSEADRAARVSEVEKKMPRRVKRKRPVTTEDGHEVGAAQGREGSPGARVGAVGVLAGVPP